MIELILFIVLGLVILVLFEWRERKRAASSRKGEEVAPDPVLANGECCGQHLVCERDTVLKMTTEIVYYDDEELDALAGKDPSTYTSDDVHQIDEVFRSLKETDIAGWARSLQMRDIELPPDIREEALLILREQRAH